MPQTIVVPLTKTDKDSHAENTGAEVVSRLGRWVMALLGGAIVAVGIVMAPLPGPFGVPVMVVGLMILLRSSFWAKRAFVKLQHRHPRIVFPLRRLLRREPEVMPVAWQQVLRFERMVLPKSWRFARRLRLSLRRKPKV
jgi:hypothetical protein